MRTSRLPRRLGATNRTISSLEQLVERAKTDGLDLVGPDGVLTGLTKTVLETGLEAELGEHLGYDKHDAEGRRWWQLAQRHPPEDGDHRGRAGEVGRAP